MLLPNGLSFFFFFFTHTNIIVIKCTLVCKTKYVYFVKYLSFKSKDFQRKQDF